MTRGTLPIAAFALAVALAPAPQDPPAAPKPREAAPRSPAELRVEAGRKVFDLAWLYYSENRIDSEKVYRWSRRLFEAENEASGDQPGRVAAAEAHLARIQRLEAKISRIRRIGFGDSLDVLEVDYYRKEAEIWLERAGAPK